MMQAQNLDEDYNEQNYKLKKLKFKYDRSIIQLTDFNEKFKKSAKQILLKLKRMQEEVEQSIQLIIEKEKQIKTKTYNFTILELYKINEEDKRINNQFGQIKLYLDQQYKELVNSIKSEQLYQMINNLSIDLNDQEFQEIQIQKIREENIKFQYEFLQQSSYKQKEVCKAIAFNKDATIMIAGCESLIKVFEFKNDYLREIQQLKEHRKDVLCLQFMKKSNQFISAYDGPNIIIWESNQNNLWQSKQILEIENCCNYCILMNQNEDMIFSGNSNGEIRLWQLQNNIWIPDQIIDCQSDVNSISLSEKEDKLIASVDDNLILVIQLQENKWKIKQRIQVEQFGCRLCFINQDQFVFQPLDRQYLLVFDYNPQYQDFIQSQKLQYQNKTKDQFSLFPIRFISKIGLVMVKYGFHVHFIGKSQNGQFTIEQSINYGSDELYGNKTDDGRYIATWNNSSKQIYIRKFDY